jgi:hypothetical protein
MATEVCRWQCYLVFGFWRLACGMPACRDGYYEPKCPSLALLMAHRDHKTAARSMAPRRAEYLRSGHIEDEYTYIANDFVPFCLSSSAIIVSSSELLAKPSSREASPNCVGHQASRKSACNY